MTILPTGRQLEVLTDHADENPVVMLNLLRYKPDGGRESYDRYSQGVREPLTRVGGRVLWYGGADSVVIGHEEADAWDAVILVRYPSRRAFLDMIQSPDYLAVAELRTDALVDSRLIACTEVFSDPG
jgi:uncharacterized protein (DUF1330 family)